MSLITPLLDFKVLVGSHVEGEGVIRGCSAGAAATGLGTADDVARGIAIRIKVDNNWNILKGQTMIWGSRRG